MRILTLPRQFRPDRPLLLSGGTRFSSDSSALRRCSIERHGTALRRRVGDSGHQPSQSPCLMPMCISVSVSVSVSKSSKSASTSTAWSTIHAGRSVGAASRPKALDAHHGDAAPSTGWHASPVGYYLTTQVYWAARSLARRTRRRHWLQGLAAPDPKVGSLVTVSHPTLAGLHLNSMRRSPSLSFISTALLCFPSHICSSLLPYRCTSIVHRTTTTARTGCSTRSSLMPAQTRPHGKKKKRNSSLSLFLKI